MNFFKKKNAEALDQINSDDDDANGSNGDDDGGRPYDPTLKEKWGRRGHKLKGYALAGTGKVKNGAKKGYQKARSVYKFATAQNYYPRYKPTEVGKFDHHAIFSGAGWKDFRFMLFWLFICNPAVILTMAPAYALYGAETAYGCYMAVKPRKMEEYKKGRPKSERQKMLDEFKKGHKQKVDVKKENKAVHKGAKRGQTYNPSTVQEGILGQVSSGTLDLD